jgi:nicotinamidase/pyrazinamidase
MHEQTITVDPVRSALLIIDVQPDFMPGGALPVNGGDQILPLVRDLMESDRFGVRVATQDWHPPGHVSFASTHPGSKPFDSIMLHGHEQTLWPDHCVQGSMGASLHPSLPWDRVAAIIRKGMDPLCDSYSGFRNNWTLSGDRPETGLAGYLRSRGVSHVYLCGLARDICVKWTAEDAVDAGFTTYYLWDATQPVDRDSDEQVRKELASAGVRLITTGQLPAPH